MKTPLSFFLFMVCLCIKTFPQRNSLNSHFKIKADTTIVNSYNSVLITEKTQFSPLSNANTLRSYNYTKALLLKVDAINGNDSTAPTSYDMGDTLITFKSVTSALNYANSVVNNGVQIGIMNTSQLSPAILSFCVIRNKIINFVSLNNTLQYIRCDSPTQFFNCKVGSYKIGFINAVSNTFAMFTLSWGSTFLIDNGGGGFYFTANNQSIFSVGESAEQVFFEADMVFDTQSFSGISVVRPSLQGGHPLRLDLDPNVVIPSNLSLNGCFIMDTAKRLHLGYSDFNQIDRNNLINANGMIQANSFRVSNLNTAPATSTDTGTTGEIRITGDYIYICVAPNNWKRATLGTW